MTNTQTSNTENLVQFSRFGLHLDIMQAINATGYEFATPIQAKSIPIILSGRDVMGAAQTGTGKTAAYSLPVLHRLMPYANTSASPARHPVRALILAPTRELADQVHNNIKQYSKFLPLRSAVVFGGVDIREQKDILRQGCEVLIATPGRLLDHIEQGTIKLNQVGILVLDEADRMLDMGFMPDLEKIVNLLPAGRQGLLFSATFSPEIRKLGRGFLQTPVEIEVTKANATADTITQIAYKIDPNDKQRAVTHLVKSRQLNQVIVFCNTKIGCSRLARQLTKDGIKVESIHGNKSQSERMQSLSKFKSGDIEVLVATDVAARGLDVVGVPCVINYDLPFNAEDYVHRIGRTGRAGTEGEAISFYSDNEKSNIKDIEKFINAAIEKGDLVLPRVPKRRGKDNKVIDEFFTKPYVPQASQIKADDPNPLGLLKPAKPKVGVLLGGK